MTETDLCPECDEAVVWGSDCVSCGHATPDSQRCDNCGSTAHTVPLYYETRAYAERLEAIRAGK